MIKNRVKNERGISLVSLAIAIVVLVILTNIIIYNIRNNLALGNLQKLKNDIGDLRDKISSYYSKNGEIPVKMEYTNIEHLKNAGIISEAIDSGKFLVIDLSAIENLTLNYGKDYEHIKQLNELTDDNAKKYTDLYIINEASHNIFYVEGIKVGKDRYYTDYTSADEMALNLRYYGGVKIPEGFYYVGGTKEEGLVISDVQGDDLDNTKGGNQFVWVPVKNKDDFKRVKGYHNDNTIENLEGLSMCGEPFQYQYYNGEEAEYNNMVKSVRSNGGFYIGRYETGKDSEGNAVVKKNATVYNDVKWGNSMTDQSEGAVQLSKQFNKGKSFENTVTSTLVYAIQWDATMQFFDSDYINETCKDDSYVKNSASKGWYSNNYQTGNPNHMTGVDLKDNNGNVLNKVKNIYDMAGNVKEWTMETFYINDRIYRGGSYEDNGNEKPASSRYYAGPTSKGGTFGFRIALYLEGTRVYKETGEYTDKNGDTATIPGGFEVSDVPGEDTVRDGLVVIAPDQSEFVWIPVSQAVSPSENAGTTNKAMAIKNGSNYRGLLYNFSGTSSTVISGCTTTASDFREPAYLTDTTSGDASTRNNVGITEALLQNEYNDMMKSVEKYKGFYVGRYKTSYDGNKVASKVSLKPMTSGTSSGNMWYGMYDKQKKYASQNSVGNVVGSSMIWGSQYDAMLNWILKGNDKNKITIIIDAATENETGSDLEGVMNNIYDLTNSLMEWTMEACNSYGRVARGGYGSSGGRSPADRLNGSNEPTNTYIPASSRITLYIVNEIKKVKPGETATKTERNNYEDENGDKATIPKGFEVSSVPGEDTVRDGLVIKDPNGNEFVWVPVPQAVSSTESLGTTNKAMAIKSGDNYKGLLYNFTASNSTVRSGCTTATNAPREPAYFSYSDYDDNTTFGKIFTEASMQTDYNNMIKSIERYGGFYVGRYEMSLNYPSKKGQTSATSESTSANMWYGLYDKANDYTGPYNSVASSMIWGSQWDAMMNWMQKCGINVTSSTPVSGASKNTGQITGSEERDKINNVYDLIGNRQEWTLEADSGFYRVYHGVSSPTFSSRTANDPQFYPDSKYSIAGTRCSLYITEEDWSEIYNQNTSYKDKNGETATIPKGFQVSKNDGEDTISKGLVIRDSNGNEFVWVSVPTAVSSTESAGSTNKAMAIKSGSNYKGLLYNFTETSSTVRSGCTTTTNDCKEPGYITGANYDDNKTYNNGLFTATSMQTNYNDMMQSVEKYKGFYIGRYEMSLNYPSKRKERAATAEKTSANTWYGLYNKANDYTGTDNSVVSSMIWGSQWDAMVNWMQKCGINVLSPTGTSSNSGKLTGIEEKDKINNIYDLMGNEQEWTLEMESNQRIVHSDLRINSRDANDPGLSPNAASPYGSRCSLYIK